MAAHPSRQETPITPTPAPLASPIHHPTPVPGLPVSSVATIFQVQDLLTPKILSYATVTRNMRSCGICNTKVENTLTT